MSQLHFLLQLPLKQLVSGFGEFWEGKVDLFPVSWLFLNLKHGILLLKMVLGHEEELKPWESL